MADELIRRGHHVAGCARDQKAVAELAATYGPPHFWGVVDVTDPTAVQTFADRVLREFGVPDLVLNNAALVNQSAALWEVPPDEFSRVIDVNIKGVFHVIRAFAPARLLNPMISRRIECSENPRALHPTNQRRRRPHSDQ
jgi:NAD(P)-dependent dehydrogenase (short-subunit alcohol dehydrogenase family)